MFDLDGTLIDSRKGLTDSFVYSMRKCGYEGRITDQILHQFIGGTLHDAYAGLCGLSDEETRCAVSVFADYYAARGMLEDRLYPGIDSALRRLHEEGITLIVITNGLEHIAVRILEHLDVCRYFALVAGLREDEDQCTKTDTIRKLKKALSFREGTCAVMIGDRSFDITAGRECGLDTIAVGYGYGSGQELLSCCPSCFCRRPEDLTAAVERLLSLPAAQQ